jgi:branched-chain amino acid transport system permease protein
MHQEALIRRVQAPIQECVNFTSSLCTRSTRHRGRLRPVAGGDRQLRVYEDFDAKQRERVGALITDELIAEHAAKPLGQHSDALERVLNYFRRQALPGKYVIVATKPWEEYRIGVLSGVRGQTARILDGEAFPTEEAAMHGIFLRRVRDLREA